VVYLAIIEITGVYPVTASRDLSEMVLSGLLTAEGNPRSRIYRAVSFGAGKTLAGLPKET
jgi:hypothetical protein